MVAHKDKGGINMLELLVIILFCWLFWQAVKLAFRIAWGTAKVIAVILFILAIPTLIGCLLFAGGMLLLLPLLLIAIAAGILRACI